MIAQNQDIRKFIVESKMKSKSIGIILYGEINTKRNAFEEDNYKELAESLTYSGFIVETITYHYSIARQLVNELGHFSAILSWVNPKERLQHGEDAFCLDDLLLSLSKKGVFVSTHPETILKIGTKKVLYSTRNMDWGGDIELYASYDDFVNNFIKTLINSNIRILKKHRGESGRGIFKIRLDETGENVRVVHAISGNEENVFSINDFFNEYKEYFEKDGLLVNQQWANGTVNGMVRCFLTGNKVSGFGYQEAVALCPYHDDPESPVRPTSRRFYFTEDCGLFQDLRSIMEAKWVPQLQEIHSISTDVLPLLWDIDLFINDVNTKQTEKKYTLCEINVSCVSPFPPSCVDYIVKSLHGVL